MNASLIESLLADTFTETTRRGEDGTSVVETPPDLKPLYRSTASEYAKNNAYAPVVNGLAPFILGCTKVKIEYPSRKKATGPTKSAKNS
jgi:hypothetical protein